MKSWWQIITGSLILIFFLSSQTVAATYLVETVEPTNLKLPESKLPDISQYTSDSKKENY